MAPTLQGWGVRSPSPRAEHYTHYLGFFCMRCVSSPSLSMHHFYISLNPWISTLYSRLYPDTTSPTLLLSVPAMATGALNTHHYRLFGEHCRAFCHHSHVPHSILVSDRPHITCTVVVP